jgi:hypothetical protein
MEVILNLIKGIYVMLKANVIHNGERLTAFPVGLEERQGLEEMLSSFPLNIGLEVLREISQEKRKEDWEKEEIKPSLFLMTCSYAYRKFQGIHDKLLELSSEWWQDIRSMHKNQL